VIPAELSGALGAVSRAFAPGAAGPAPAPAGPVQDQQPTADPDDILDADLVEDLPEAPPPAEPTTA
jgi:hypothetical protein